MSQASNNTPQNSSNHDLVAELTSLGALKVIDPLDVPYWERLSAWSRLASGAYAAKTMKAFRFDWKIFVRFCVDYGFKPLPAAPETVRLFILSSIKFIERDVLDGELLEMITLIEEELRQNGVGRVKSPCRITTLDRYLSSISAAHRAADLPNPRHSEKVRLAFKQARRVSDGKPNQRSPVRINHIEAIAALPCETLRDEQDVLLALVAYQTGARGAAVCRIGVNDIDWREGYAFVNIWREKTDQSNTGRYRRLGLETSARLREWISKNGMISGPVFRGATGPNTLGKKTITTNTVRAAIKRAMVRIGESSDNIGAHSLRIGGAQDLRANKFSMVDIMSYGDWKTERMPARYARELDAEEEGITKVSKNL